MMPIDKLERAVMKLGVAVNELQANAESYRMERDAAIQYAEQLRAQLDEAKQTIFKLQDKLKEAK